MSEDTQDAFERGFMLGFDEGVKQGRKIDGDWLNNLIENLRFLCPNCHSQQETTNKPWKSKPA